MNWFDAERMVLQRHDEAWEVLRPFAVAERPYRRRLQHYAARLGVLMVRWGTRLQGGETQAGQVQVYHNGSVSSTGS